MARPPLAGAISERARPIIISRMWRSRQVLPLPPVFFLAVLALLLSCCFFAVRGRCSFGHRVLARRERNSRRIGVRCVLSSQIVRLVSGCSCPARGERNRGQFARIAACSMVAPQYILADEDRQFHLRWLLPPQYILADEDRQFHLRCVLIGAGRAPISGGAYGLCDLAWKVLAIRGSVVAAIVSSDRQAGVLVYDDTESTELVARRAPQLLHKMGLELYDSSLFPLVADPVDRDASMLRRLLPQCVTDDEERYRRRVLLFSGLDTQKLDAADFAYFLQSEADLVHTVEAVIIHRSEGLAVVVLGSSDDTLRLLYTPEETWVRFFGQEPGWASVCGFGGPYCESAAASSEQHSVMMGAWHLRDTAAVDRVKDWIWDELVKLRDDDTIGFVHCLIRGCALADPNCVLRSGFPERALLLSGVAQGINSSDLRVKLLPGFGEVDASAVENGSRMALALVVFRCWHSAARLLRETEDTWAGLGFVECSRVPDAEHAGVIAQEVVDQLLQ